jgi:hypothetical protein
VRKAGLWGVPLRQSHSRQKDYVHMQEMQGRQIRAEHIEPLVLATVVARLAKPDAVKLLRKNVHNATDADRRR